MVLTRFARPPGGRSAVTERGIATIGCGSSLNSFEPPDGALPIVAGSTFRIQRGSAFQTSRVQPSPRPRATPFEPRGGLPPPRPARLDQATILADLAVIQ